MGTTVTISSAGIPVREADNGMPVEVSGNGMLVRYVGNKGTVSDATPVTTKGGFPGYTQRPDGTYPPVGR